MSKIICVGLGPGDPELMSVRADRLISNASTVAYFRKAGRKGQARQIVEGMLSSDVVEIPMEYPVTTEIPVKDQGYNDLLAQFYEEKTTLLLEHCQGQDQDIIVLCEGDPFFYGSFMHLYVRLREHIEIEVVPGITGMSGCWTATGIPMTWGDDILTVLMGTLPEDRLLAGMQNTDAFVVMKTGRNLPKIRQALQESNRLSDAWIVSYGTMAKEEIMPLSSYEKETAPYFTIILVHGKGRRPQ